MAVDRRSSEWMKAENEMIRLLMEMQSRWANALQAAHQCERMKMETPFECVIRLDMALDEARELEKLVRRYIEVLNRMKELIQSE